MGAQYGIPISKLTKIHLKNGRKKLDEYVQKKISSLQLLKDFPKFLALKH